MIIKAIIFILYLVKLHSSINDDIGTKEEQQKWTAFVNLTKTFPPCVKTREDIFFSLVTVPHSGYFNIDVYLLQFLCHMTSDFKFSHMLFFLFSLLFKSKTTLTIKQILIFLEAVFYRYSRMACNFITKRLQHRCFPVKIAKFLRTLF